MNEKNKSKAGKYIGPLALASVGLMGLLTKWEGGHELTVYADKLAQGLPTVCKGLTKHVTNTPIIVGERWTEEQCEREEFAALIKVQTAVHGCFTITPPQEVFDAASSHAWNNGAGSTCTSLAMEAFRRGAWDLGCQRLGLSDSGKPVWSFVKTGRVINGKPEYKFVQGLANRRAAETKYCKGRND